MRAKAFQGGDLDASQCRIFPVQSAGVRQLRPVPSCLPCLACLWGQEQELAGRKGLTFAGANYTAGILLCLSAFR